MAERFRLPVSLQEEYKDYIARTPMSRYERKLLRRWVSEGHSVYESPGSQYLCSRYPESDFLETYREDRKIKEALRGKSPSECERYLKEYMGWDDDTTEPEHTLKDAQKYIREIEHDLFYLWEFICHEGLWAEADEYIKHHKDDPVPFGWDYKATGEE